MKAVIVTGASTGIGRSCAERLAADGFRVFAGVRTADDARAIEKQLGGEIQAVHLELTDPGSIAAAKEIVEEQAASGLAALVNNAGIGIPGPLEVLPIEQFREQLEVNLVGQLAVTQAFLPALRRSAGRVVFIGSIGGKAATPFAGAYHASKFAIEGMADSLRQELRDSGVDVILVEPGPVDTPIWSKAAVRTRALAARLSARARAEYAEDLAKFEERLEGAADSAIPPGRVADVVAEAVSADRPSSRYPVGTAARLLYRFRPLIPDRIFDALVARPF